MASSENWTLDVQWQPYSSLLLDIGYVGNHGQHLLLPIPFNQPGIATPTNPINGQIYSYGFQATDADGGSGTLLTEEAATTIGNFTAADGNTALRVPFIGYNPNSDFWEAEGISNYHALQFSAKKLLSHGLMINASYTWSHVLDEGSGISEGLFFNGNNPLNPRSAYGSSAFDRTHVFTISYLYNVPDINHPSFDAPNNNLTLNPCDGPNPQTSPFAVANGFGCQWLGVIPGVTGSGGPIGNGTAQFGEGVIQNTLGSPRFIQFALHLTF